MTILDQNFHVEFADASYSFFEKDFAKHYPKGWVETKKMIRETLRRAAAFQRTSRISPLKPMSDATYLYKLEFAVAGTHISPKAAGNRVVFSLSNSSGLVRVLLIYSKNHLPKNKPETEWIFQMVKEKYGLS
jgi:hypothetical protein